jgi:Mor family transcriptional regulator
MPSAGEAFQRELIDSMPSPHSKLVAIAVCAKWAGASIYLPAGSKAARRVAAATHALRNGMSPADVTALLRVRYGISARQASRDVRKAKPNVSETCPPSTVK